MCAIKWKSIGSTKGSKIKILDKEEIKEELGCSPDHADNAAQAMIGAELAQEVEVIKIDGWRNREAEEDYNWRAG